MSNPSVPLFIKLSISPLACATDNPSNATNKVLNYTSSNTSVAVVDGRGTVRGLSKGSTIVKITAHNGIQKAVYVVVE